MATTVTERSNVCAAETRAHHSLSLLIRRAGGHVGSLSLQYRGSTGWGVFATAPIAAGELLLSVPRELILCAASGEEKPVEELRLMLLTQRRTPGSLWAEWFEMLPAKFGLPVEWSEEERAQLACPALEAAIAEERSQIIEAFNRIEVGRLPGITLDEYMWAASAVLSRAACLVEAGPMQTGEEGMVASSQGVPAIVPFGDMFNHLSTEAPAHAFFDRKESAYRYFALHDVPQGMEVCLSYGCHDDAVLLRCYGFVPAENPHRRCEILLPLDSIQQAHLQWIEENGLDCDHYVSDEGPSWSLMGVARFMHASADELECGAALAILEGEVVSPRCERLALECIRSAAAKRMNEIESSMNEQRNGPALVSTLRRGTQYSPDRKRKREAVVAETSLALEDAGASGVLATTLQQDTPMDGPSDARAKIAIAFRDAHLVMLRTAIERMDQTLRALDRQTPVTSL